ncbi:MAG: AtpZ/AtpI family protein [Planctomycetaceae bacterium]|nr:AtpZ/AtpI family protein [Planctomycetaceae bacterium]
MEWVAKITTVALEMCLPAVGGQYLDQRFGTSYWAMIGLVLGVTVGTWHLVQMTQAKGQRTRPSKQSPSKPGHSNRGSAGSPGD